MKYFLIAGEPSGDQHAAKLIKALKMKDPEADFAFLGGDCMESHAGPAVVHIRQMAFMGFTQILSHLGKIRRNFRAAKEGIEEFKPDALILVDYAGFNLRMAKWAHQKGIKVYYYIAPKVWAWNTKRVKKIRKSVDHVLAILPFETDFFHQHQVDCTYVGNPVLEDINELRVAGKDLEGLKDVIALLPGSRKQEIKRVLPIMISVASEYPDYQFVIAGMSGQKHTYSEFLSDAKNIEILYDQTRELLSRSIGALVTSGTATLETALLGVPQLVCYKTNELSYQIARKMIKVSYISLVNLIMNGPAVPEYVQKNCTLENLSADLKMILPGGENHKSQIEICDNLRKELGDFEASDNAAELIIRLLAMQK